MKVFDEIEPRIRAAACRSAEKLPGSGGITTVGIESSRAERAGVQRPAAAIAEQHELARIEPVLGPRSA